MTQASVAQDKTRAQISERTLREDPWWRAPAITATLLTIWVAYATVHVFIGKWYWVPRFHYLTPFYSPCISGECVPGSASLGTWFGKVPPIIPYALVSLPFVLGFRLTCYYYRRAYYRAFWRAPAACAVREPRASYSGETRFPLIMQNLHRYFFFMVLLISCHSCRHITGGRLKNFSRHPGRYWAWTQVSRLNAKHMQLAWATLGTLMITDLYIWLVAAGVFNDPRIFN
jgi:hypothetical protein